MKTLFLAVILAVALLSLESCDCYRILGVFSFQGKSHFYMFEALMKGLARKGHRVDVISSFPQKHPPENYTDIVVLPVTTAGVHNNLSYHDVMTLSAHLTHWVATDVGNGACASLGLPDMLKFVKNPPKDPPYDLVIIEYLAAHCFAALGQHLKVPVIGAISSALYLWNNRAIANPSNLAFVPNNFLDYAQPLNFWQRMHNTMSVVYSDLYFRYITSAQDDMLKQYFGKDTPGVREMEKNIVLVLVNTHHSIYGTKPMSSNLIEVGGLHIQDDGPELSKDLQKWMDDSTEGFVYFTFGSMITIESSPEDTLRALYKSFKKIAPMRVLLKIPDPSKLPPGLPANVRAFKWTSQLKVLKHKNVKAFITHGGLMGSMEAIHCAVPMIGVPIFADQLPNVEYWVKKKIAVKLRFENITEESMDWALKEITGNPLYKKKMQELSDLFSDRPMKPLDTAIWWVEYVIRNRENLPRSAALDLDWWQIELLDVYGFLLLILALLTFLTIRSVQFLHKRCNVIVKFVGIVKSNKVE